MPFFIEVERIMWFLGLKVERICEEINSAEKRVIYASPGIRKAVCDAIIKTITRLGSDAVTVIVDCDEETCRLGYGDIEAIKLLISKGVSVRQSKGLRFGLLICDDRGWSFAPVALYVEDDTQSVETANATVLVPEQIEALVTAICPRTTETADTPEAEIGVAPVEKSEVSKTEEGLEIAPPLRFDIARQVRVFQPYIQYVELHLEGCSIQKRVVNIPTTIVNRRVSEELAKRLKTQLGLIEKNSELSDKHLQNELKSIREDYIKNLGKPWGSVMLRHNRNEFDKKVEALREKVHEHHDRVSKHLQQEIDHSRKQVVDSLWRDVANNPPDKLRCQILTSKPDEKIARDFLQGELARCFPTAEKILTQMKLDCQFRDVTYETLTQEGFIKALRKAFPFVPWDKPFDEFNAAKEK
jgi:hypothetical protein